MNWWKELKGKVRLSEPLKNHTSFRIGGPVKFFVEPKDTGDLKLALNLAKRYKVPVLMIGAGSNLLVSDKGVNAMALHLNSSQFKKIFFKDNFAEAAGGAMLGRLVSESKKRGLSGAEFLVGIPGTIGGALAMNAGIPSRDIADIIDNVTVMDYNGNIKVLRKSDLKFGYRKSNLAKYIILESRLKLSRSGVSQVQDRIREYLLDRKARQDISKPSAGCVFKNPRGYSAGKLIDLCGLKGKTVGSARISDKHANFILNLGTAKAADILKLMCLIKKEVKSKFDIDLEPEIKIWR